MDDVIRIKCPNPDCTQQLKFSSGHVGRRGRCVRCDMRFVIGQSARTEAADLVREEVGAATDPRVENKEKPSDPLVGAAEFVRGLSRPLIRVRLKLWKTEVVAIYDTHITTGTRYVTELRFTEEMCEAEGESALRERLHRSQQIEFSDVMQVDEEQVMKSSSTFWVRSFDGKSAKFVLPLSQVGHVRLAFKHYCLDCYRVRKFRSRVWQFALLVVAGALIAVVSLIYIADGGAKGLLVSGLGLAGFATACFFLLRRRRGGWKRVDEEAGKALHLEAMAPKKEKRKQERAGDQDVFRSKRWGWALKIAGLLYWVAVESPLTHGVGEFIEHHHLDLFSSSAIWGLILYPCAALIYYGYSLCQVSFDPETMGGGRKPILYLRPFDDDASTTLQPVGLLAYISGLRSTLNPWGGSSTASETGRVISFDRISNYHPVRLARMVFDRDIATSEESIVRFFDGYGPVVAIGKPGEGVATPGARRVYVGDDQWQNTVLRTMAEAQAVVIQPGRTAGVRWEMEQIRKSIEPYRVLLCLVSFWRDPQAYEELQVLFREAADLELPLVVPFLRNPAFLYFDRRWRPKLQRVSHCCPILWPVLGNAVDLKHTLRSFVGGLDGSRRKMPRSPRWQGGLATVLASLCAAVVALVIVFAPSEIVKNVTSGGGALIARLSSTSGNTRSEQASWSSLSGRLRRIAINGATDRGFGDSGRCSFQIPESFVEKPRVNGPLADLEYKSADDLLHMLVSIGSFGESPATLAAHRLEVNKLDPRQDVRLESTGTVWVDGVEWAEVRILVRAENGVSMREVARLTNGERGRVFVAFHIIENGDDTNDRIANEILASFRLK